MGLFGTVGGLVGSYWGPVGSAVGSGIGGFLDNQQSANDSQANAIEMQDRANAFSAHQYATRYQTTVKDLQEAGLNPALAYGGMSGGFASSANVGYAPANYGGGEQFSASAMQSAQIANIIADTHNKEASADLIQAQIAGTNASAGQAQAQARVLDTMVNKIMWETNNLQNENQRLIVATRALAEQAQLWAEQGKSQSFIREQLVAAIGKMNAETSLLELDAKAAAKLDNMGREFGQLKPFVDTIVQILRTFRR